MPRRSARAQYRLRQRPLRPRRPGQRLDLRSRLSVRGRDLRGHAGDRRPPGRPRGAHGQAEAFARRSAHHPAGPVRGDRRPAGRGRPQERGDRGPGLSAGDARCCRARLPLPGGRDALAGDVRPPGAVPRHRGVQARHPRQDHARSPLEAPGHQDGDAARVRHGQAGGDRGGLRRRLDGRGRPGHRRQLEQRLYRDVRRGRYPPPLERHPPRLHPPRPHEPGRRDRHRDRGKTVLAGTRRKPPTRPSSPRPPTW